MPYEADLSRPCDVLVNLMVEASNCPRCNIYFVFIAGMSDNEKLKELLLKCPIGSDEFK